MVASFRSDGPPPDTRFRVLASAARRIAAGPPTLARRPVGEGSREPPDGFNARTQPASAGGDPGARGAPPGPAPAPADHRSRARLPLPGGPLRHRQADPLPLGDRLRDPGLGARARP